MMIKTAFFFTFVALSFLKEIFGNPSPFLYFNKDENCVCGKHFDVGSRIVGGREADPNRYPWIAAILYDGRLVCGGTLINNRYVLTAGHCLNWTNKKKTTVVLGLYDRILMEKEKKGGTEIEVESFIVHEDFTSDYIHDSNDIALIKLKINATFGPHVLPICLPKNDNSDHSNTNATIAGWGKVAESKALSRVLLDAQVNVITNDKCKEIKELENHILDSMLCAYKQNVDACQGDSGGPLLHETNPNHIVQIGVVSWGIGCANPGMPGIYTRVSKYLEWINLHTLDSDYCENRF